jgi:hypothetical protein
MFLVDPLGPAAGELVFQRFRLADSTEWILPQFLD